MPKYMFKANYSPTGTTGLVAEGAKTRLAMATGLAKAAGGTLEAMYFSSGENDAYVIADIPDDSAALVVKLVLNGTGAIDGRAIPLLTAEEADAATARAKQVSANFRPPGS